MKRIMGLLIALVILLTAVLVPMPAVNAEEVIKVTHHDFNNGRWGTELLSPSTEIDNHGSYERLGDIGTITITYNVASPEAGTDSAWVKYYLEKGMPQQLVGIEKPANAISGVCIRIDGTTYTQDDLKTLLNGETAWQGGDEGWGGFFPTFDLVKLYAESNTTYLETLNSTTTFLTAWKDKDGNLIDLSGNGEKIYVEATTVTISHTNQVKQEITLSKIATFNFDNNLGYGVGHDPLNGMDYGSWRNGGVLHIDYIVPEQSQWEAVVGTASKPQHQIGLIRPRNAVTGAMFIAIDGKDEDDAIAYLEGNAEWVDVTQGDMMYRFPVMDYTIDATNEKDVKITYTPLYPDFDVYVSWKDADGKLIDLGLNQYIAKLNVEVGHEVAATKEPWTKSLGDQSVDSPYDFSVPLRSKILNVGIRGVDSSCFKYDLDKIKDGQLTITIDMDAEDWERAYEAQPVMGLPISLDILVEQPASGASFVHQVQTGSKPNKDLADGMLNAWHMEVVDGLTEMGTVAANYTTSGHEVTIVPVEETHTFMLSWRVNNPEGPNYNFGSFVKPIYTEYLTVTLKHKNASAVKFTSNVGIDTDAITPNAYDLEDKYFTKETEYENDILTYYVDAAELQKAIDQDGLIFPYEVIGTFVKAPENAVKAIVNGNEVQMNAENKGVYLNSRLPIQDNTLRFDSQRLNYTIVWIDADGNATVKKITINLNVITGETWLDNVFDAKPIPTEDIKISDVFDGSNGVKIDVVKDGCMIGSLSGEKIVYGQVKSDKDDAMALIKIPEGAVYYKEAGGSGANFYMGESMAEEMEAFLDGAKLTQIEPDAKNPGYLAISRLTTVRKVHVSGKYGTSAEVIMPGVIGFSDYCCTQQFIQWFDKDENPIMLTAADGSKHKTQYWYYMLDMEQEITKSNGVVSEDALKEPVKNPTIIHGGCDLEIEEYQQEQTGGDQNAYCHYVHIRMKNKINGMYEQPKEETTIYIPYPDGLDYDQCKDGKHNFTLRHYLDDNHTRHEDIVLEPKPYGLCGKITSCSPFMLCWEEESDQEDPKPDDDTTESTPPAYYPDYDTDDEEQDAGTGTQTYQVLCRKLNVRLGAGTEFAKIGTLQRGQTIDGVMLENGWIQFITDDGITAYVCGQYTEAMDAADSDCADCTGNGQVVCRTLNVRSGPRTSFKRIGRITRSSAVEIIGCNEDHTWYQIKWDDGYAWVCAKYIAR